MKKGILTLLPVVGAAVLGVNVLSPLDGQTGAPRSISFYDDAKLSKPAYKIRTEANVRVPMRDGVTLAADIYRPDAPGKFPVILVRTPYNRATAVSVPQARWFAERGYVVVEQDVRGRWDSDGHFYGRAKENGS